MRAGWGLFLLFLFLALPCHAAPKVLVILADHLTLADVTRPNLTSLPRMDTDCQIGLMSPGLPQGKDPVATVYATLGAGDSIRVGNVSQGRFGQVLAAAHLKTALIGNDDGDDTGEYRPAALILPSPTETFAGANNDGTVPDPLACGGRRVDPARLWQQTRTALQQCDLVVVQDGDFARIERENQQGYLLPQSYRQHGEQALRSLDAFWGLATSLELPGSHSAHWTLLVVPTPPLNAHGGWDRLTPLILLPPQPDRVVRTGMLARSDTTQTPGLVAARDFAPTVLRLLDVTPPVQMTGAVIDDTPAGGNTLATLRRLARLTNLNQDAQNPLFWTLGFLAAAVLFVGLGLFLSGRMASLPGARGAALYGLRLLSAWPLALLLAPLTDPTTLTLYFVWMIALTAVLALIPSPGLIYSLTAVVLVADGLTGTHLISQSVLSAYALSGIRFYGIGNEYMGLLIGGALLFVSSIPKITGGKAALVFAVVIFVLSFPEFGAKAGGAVTATAIFVIAWRRLRGLPVTARHILFGLLAGFGLVFLWALVDHWVPMRRTHIDTAVGALGQGRLGYIAGVAIRKIGLAAHVFLHPGTLLGILGIALVGGVARLFLRRQVKDYLDRHPRFAAVWSAGLWGSLIAILFNDSGIVAAILLLTSLIVALLHGLYQECVLLPSTSAKSASASPSVTF